jgi:hypothetical protein
MGQAGQESIDLPICFGVFRMDRGLREGGSRTVCEGMQIALGRNLATKVLTRGLPN